MIPEDKILSYHRNTIGIVSVVALTMLFFLSACSVKRKKEVVPLERDSLPVMATYDVSTIVSDSGIARYRVEAGEWLIYDRKDPQYWSFEKGLHLERFDSLLTVDAFIDSDTAYYYTKEKLWELRGNVHVENLKGETFSTELLFWSEREEKVYSDKFIKINQIDRIISGYGFESNQQMTVYTIHNIEGVFYVDEGSISETKVEKDSVNLKD